MNILLLGNSPYLKKRISNAYPQAKIIVVSWREMLSFKITGSYEYLLVAGYDYGSYLMPFRFYILNNIIRPFNFIKKFQMFNSEAQIIYVATAYESGACTYSRYRYAKERLGFLIFTKIKNSYILRFNSFTDEYNKLSVSGGNKMIFGILARFGLVRMESVQTIEMAFVSPRTTAVSEMSKCKGFLLIYPRTQFLDRLLRVCYG